MKSFTVLLFILFFHQTSHAEISLKPDFYRTCTILANDDYCELLVIRFKEIGGQAKEGGGIMLDTFHNDIRPEIMEFYKSYQNVYGDKIGESFWRTYDQVSPYVAETYKTTKEYWYDQFPDFFDDISYIPTPIKRGQEKLLFAVWDAYESDVISGKAKLPELYQVATQMLLDVSKIRKGEIKAAPGHQERLDRLLNDIRGASLDKEMINCFKVYAVPSEIANGFNTVCSIFLNQPLYENLTDNEVRAVIAHEMGHGINGDSVKTFAKITKHTLNHFLKLGIEELNWIMTDETMEYFGATLETGSFEMVMLGVAEEAPLLEMNADITGVRILNRAGYSGEPLITALYKLHGLDPGEEVKDEANKKSFRNYPSLYKRLQAIRGAMKF